MGVAKNRGVVNLLVGLLLSGFLAFGGLATRAAGQDATMTKPTAEGSQSEIAESGQQGGRLPRYFAAIVDQSQRDEIYRIQAGYRTRIAELRAQLTALEGSQAAEIEAVLTPSQRETLEARKTSSRSLTNRTQSAENSVD